MTYVVNGGTLDATENGFPVNPEDRDKAVAPCLV